MRSIPASLAPVPCLADRASCRLTRAPAAEPYWRDHLAFLSDRAIAHRQVSVLRAAQKVVAADPDWIACRIEGPGRGWVFLNLANVQSYTLGRIIIDTSNVYRSKKRAQRQPGQWVGAGPGFRRKIVDDHRDIVPDRAELLGSCCYGPSQRALCETGLLSHCMA